MNQWEYMFAILLILLVLIIGMITCIILLCTQKARKQNNKCIVIAMAMDIMMILTILLYNFSHSTYYKYNDWKILQTNINSIKEKYGEFDLGKITDNEKGVVAYYIYTDNGPIMSDNLKHYYYIEYDENGTVYNVYDAGQPGG